MSAEPVVVNVNCCCGKGNGSGGGSNGGGGSIPLDLYAGDIRFFPFRADSLPAGWYATDGRIFESASVQAIALLSLPEEYREDWGIVETGEGVNVPNTLINGDEEGGGYFLRSVDGVTRKVGSVQPDALQGHKHFEAHAMMYVSGNNGEVMPSTSSSAYKRNVFLETDGAYEGEHGVPRIAKETRGINVGMTSAIYLGV